MKDEDAQQHHSGRISAERLVGEGVNDEVVHNEILEIKNRLADVGEVVGHTLGVLRQRQIFRSY